MSGIAYLVVFVAGAIVSFVSFKVGYRNGWIDATLRADDLLSRGMSDDELAKMGERMIERHEAEERAREHKRQHPGPR